jgi:hypothetical protein
MRSSSLAITGAIAYVQAVVNYIEDIEAWLGLMRP